MSIHLSSIHFGNLDKIRKNANARQEKLQNDRTEMQKNNEARENAEATTLAKRLIHSGFLNAVAVPAAGSAESLTYGELLTAVDELIKENSPFGGSKSYIDSYALEKEIYGNSGRGDALHKLEKAGLINRFETNPGDKHPIFGIFLSQLGKAALELMAE